MGDIEDGVALLVVVALVEAVMLVLQDVVHGDDGILMVFAVIEPKVAHIVLRLSVVVFHDFETV